MNSVYDSSRIESQPDPAVESFSGTLQAVMQGLKYLNEEDIVSQSTAGSDVVNFSPIKSSILIIDDDQSNISRLGSLFTKDYEVGVAMTGEQALAVIFKNRHVDLVLIDVDIPGMSGYQVCEILKSDPVTRDIPVIFVTTRSDEKDEQKGLELGAVDYIIKPFKLASVKVRVKNHLELKRQRDLLAHLSTHDGLTGIANRRRFEDYLQSEWQRAKRLQSPLSLILVDVDYFKQFNDHYGHVAGDQCLRKIAQSLEQTNKRSSDLVARYGGEEFVCLLPGTDIAGGIRFAEEMRRTIAALLIPHGYSQVASSVTVSVGIAEIIPGFDKLPESLIDAADKQLYRAKSTGRNCVRA